MNALTATRSVHEALGSYVVGALEPTDRAAFERHLTRCDCCRREAVAFEETASELGLLAASPPPPPELRDAVLAAIPRTAQLTPTARSADSPARPRRSTRVLAVLVAAVSVVALALGGVAHSLATRPSTPVASADASLLAAPDVRILPATLPDGTHVSFVESRSQNRAVFVATDLPDPGLGRTYQLWLLRGGTPLPDATLGGGTEVTQWFHGPVRDAGGFAVTVEPVGGSRQPTSPVLASGTV